MWRWWLILFASLAWGGERWVRFASGPFEVLTGAGTRAGRETLVRLEEFRHALGQVIGEQNLEAPVPVRVMVFRDARAWVAPEPVPRGRAGYAVVLAGDAPPSRAVLRELTRLFLEANTARLPAGFERGLIDFFAMIEVSGIRITAGQAPAAPTLDWARVHLLVTDPQYYGRLRVVLYNLRRGVDEDVAFRNAFGKSARDIEAEARAHLAAGKFGTVNLSSLPMTARDFEEKPVVDADARLARADLLIPAQSAPEYQRLIAEKIHLAESYEGLGLLALRAGRAAEARKMFSAAIGAGGASAGCYLEYGRLEPDTAAAMQAFERAAALNTKLDEPHWLMAQRETDPARRAARLRAAVERNPRRLEYWKALAEAALAQHDFAAAARAWNSAAQAAADPAERQRMLEARLSVEQQRLDWEAAERRRVATEKAREIETLKTEARAEVRALEQRYSQAPPTAAAVPWWDGPRPPGKVRGTLKQVDCLGKQARLVVEDDERKTIRLLVPDPAQVAILGPGGTHTLGCGAQKARRVTVEYFPKSNARLATAGDVATIEFQ